MITCSRCGKENQDHYKFCLGCGNEIKAVAKPAREPAPLETARTVLPPEPKSQAGMIATEATPLPSSSSSPKPKGGIPWGDSPKMPAPSQANGSAPVGAALDPTPAPVTTSSGSSSSAAGTWASRPTSGAQAAVSSMVSVAVQPTPFPLQTGGLTPGPSPRGVPPGVAAPSGQVAPEGTTCPSCGRAVPTGFAFCGACGTRIPSAGMPSATSQRPAPVSAPVPRGRIVLIRPDGSEGGAHPLFDGENLVGRGQGSLFEGDLYLSPRHAEFVLGPQGLMVRDLRSLNGVFLKIAGEEPLESGDVIRIGQELLRFEIIAPPAPLEDGTEVAGTPNPGFWGRLSVVVGRDVDGSAFPLFGDAIVMGRERGDILFPEDGYVSGTHARISLRNGRVYLADVGSSNGTFLRVRGERELPAGGFALMGQQLFRAEYR